jgi:hypothetical protein
VYCFSYCDNESLCVQLEAVRANGICTTEIVKPSVVIVSKLSSEVQQLGIGNETLTTQLRDLQLASSHVPSVRREVVSSVAANNATVKS